MTKPKQSAWDKRKRRVMGDDPDDPSLALPAGEWKVDPKTGVRRYVQSNQK